MITLNKDIYIFIIAVLMIILVLYILEINIIPTVYAMEESNISNNSIINKNSNITNSKLSNLNHFKIDLDLFIKHKAIDVNICEHNKQDLKGFHVVENGQNCYITDNNQIKIIDPITYNKEYSIKTGIFFPEYSLIKDGIIKRPGFYDETIEMYINRSGYFPIYMKSQYFNYQYCSCLGNCLI